MNKKESIWQSLFRGICLMVLAQLVWACGTSMGSFERESATSQRNQVGNLSSSYSLGANDVIRIQVFDEQELTTETEVSGEGKINFPLLGELKIGGKTIREVEQYITDLLKKGYINNPKVNVYMVKYRPIFVSGEVKSPGAFPYQEGLTILRAITLAGGYTEKAAKSRTQVIRMENGREISAIVRLDSLIRPDDIVMVPESFF